MIIKDKNYLNIQGWMVTELGLTGNKLLVYAIIFGFSQDGEGAFTGSLRYIQEWTGLKSKSSVIPIMKLLVSGGFVTKKTTYINGITHNSYKIVEKYTPISKSDTGISKSDMGGISKSAPYNKDSKQKSNSKRKISTTTTSKPKTNNSNYHKIIKPLYGSGVFVDGFVNNKETIDMFNSLNSGDVVELVEFMVPYISNGKKIKGESSNEFVTDFLSSHLISTYIECKELNNELPTMRSHNALSKIESIKWGYSVEPEQVPNQLLQRI